MISNIRILISSSVVGYPTFRIWYSTFWCLVSHFSVFRARHQNPNTHTGWYRLRGEVFRMWKGVHQCSQTEAAHGCPYWRKAVPLPSMFLQDYTTLSPEITSCKKTFLNLGSQRSSYPVTNDIFLP